MARQAHAGSERRAHSLHKAHCAFAENRFAEALTAYDEAVCFGENRSHHAYERWMCCMKLGDFNRAWQETDSTEAARNRSPQHQADLPPHLQRVWDGSPITNRRVLVRCYHGLGDTIQFIRYLPLLSEVAAFVTLHAQPALIPLLGSFRKIAEVVPADKSLTERAFDVAVELMELPYVFRTWLDSIPVAVPYLHISPELRHLRWLELTRLGLRSASFNVGVTWSSGDWNPERNIDLRLLASLAAVPGVQLFALQRGLAAENIHDSGFPIASAEREFGTVLDTAAAILNLDLILSVDTMVAHLAGALGKPVWTLLPFCSDWRWLADREDSPWYPTMRLFHQPDPGVWAPVIEQVRGELSLHCVPMLQAA